MNISKLKESAVSYALANGLLHGEMIGEKQYYTHMPISLFPFVLPKTCFDLGERLDEVFGELVMRICNRPDWLFEQMKDVTDDFTLHLIDIAKEAIQCPFYQPVALGIMRSDYMIDQSTPDQFLQIELNTISCSFVGVEEKLSQLHQFVLSSNKEDLAAMSTFMGLSIDDMNSFIDCPSFNTTCHQTCQSLANAVAYYNTLFHVSNTCILIVNQENENNNVDQFLLSTRLAQIHHLPCIYQTHTELASSMTLQDGVMQVNGQEVAVVYYRSAYTPSDYPSPLQWEVRRQIECSRAIKCPNILLHIAGCKKIQQQLCLPSLLEDLFENDGEKIALLRSCFTELVPAWEVAKDEEWMKKVCENPQGYVLKPQREGGGYNIWGQDIVDTLMRKDSNELASLILMKRICPKESMAYHIKEGTAECLPSLSEIGFYSSVLFDAKKKEVVENSHIGVLIRTKVAHSNEGGVSAGFAVMNSPIISNN